MNYISGKSRYVPIHEIEVGDLRTVRPLTESNATFSESTSSRQLIGDRMKWILLALSTGVICLLVSFASYPGVAIPRHVKVPVEGLAISSEYPPYSVVDPRSLGIKNIERPEVSRPGEVFGKMLETGVPIPTNSWCENFLIGGNINDESNKVFQVPYVVDTAGSISGLRVHSANVKVSTKS